MESKKIRGGGKESLLLSKTQLDRNMRNPVFI
jgi:hypothetical protein